MPCDPEFNDGRFGHDVKFVSSGGVEWEANHLSMSDIQTDFGRLVSVVGFLDFNNRPPSLGTAGGLFLIAPKDSLLDTVYMNGVEVLAFGQHEAIDEVTSCLLVFGRDCPELKREALSIAARWSAERLQCDQLAKLSAHMRFTADQLERLLANKLVVQSNSSDPRVIGRYQLNETPIETPEGDSRR